MSTHTVICRGEAFTLCGAGLALFQSHTWGVFRGKRGHTYLKRNGDVPGRVVYFHRELLGLSHGDGVVADHINRNTRDMRRENLRAVDHFTNNANRALRNGGAGKAKNGWIARISRNGVRKYLGYFPTQAEAAAAYAHAAEIAS